MRVEDAGILQVEIRGKEVEFPLYREVGSPWW